VATEDYVLATEDYVMATEDYVMETEGYVMATGGYVMATEGYVMTTEGYVMATEGYVMTTEDYVMATEGYVMATEVYVMVTEGYVMATEVYVMATGGYVMATEGYVMRTLPWINFFLFSTYAPQPSRLIVRSWLDAPTFSTKRLHACHHARAPSGGKWNFGREMSGKFCLNGDFHVSFRDLLHAIKLRHGTDGFTSPPKEGVLGNFSP
jgi:hypothetical protein